MERSAARWTTSRVELPVCHDPRVRTGVVLVSLLIAATPTLAATPARYWSTTKVLRRLDGAKVTVGARKVRVRSATTLCAGQGTSVRRHGIRLWRRFACTYTTFTKAGVDRDLDFRVRAIDATRFAVTDAHWVRPGRTPNAVGLSPDGT